MWTYSRQGLLNGQRSNWITVLFKPVQLSSSAASKLTLANQARMGYT
jgi:hypothetical protein